MNDERQQEPVAPKREYRAWVERELSENRELYALFLIHGFVESFLREMLYVMGGFTKAKLSKTQLDDIDKINFKNLLLVQAALGNLSEDVYEQAAWLNHKRNDLAHDLITTYLSTQTFRDEITQIAKRGLDVCDRVYDAYAARLLHKARELQKNPPHV